MAETTLPFANQGLLLAQKIKLSKSIAKDWESVGSLHKNCCKGSESVSKRISTGALKGVYTVCDVDSQHGKTNLQPYILEK